MAQSPSSDLNERMLACENWVKENTGLTFKVGDFHGNLKDGTALCLLASKIDPSLMDKKLLNSKKQGPFNQKERITAAVEAFRKMGVDERNLFTTDDLHVPNNLKQVVFCLETLSSKCLEKYPNIKGQIGFKYTEKQEKQWTEEQERKAKVAIPRMQSLTRQVEDNEHVDSHGVVLHSNVSKTEKKNKQSPRPNE